ncbi:MAG: TonB-dependent receptor [Balneolaceae bacterium]
MPKLTITLFTLLLLSATCGTQRVLSQSAAIQGFTSDQSTGQTLEGVNVVVNELDNNQPQGTPSDRNGFYRVDDLEPGTYEVTFSYVGFVTFRDTLSLSTDERKTINVALEPDEAFLDEVTVEPTIARASKREVGAQRITSESVQRVPTPAGSGDLTSYLQAMPGVVTSGDRGGQLFIRGGTSTENMILVDGLMIYQPFHIVGFFSPFPEGLVSGADFYAGGFSPRYTGRLSSVLDIQMREGNRNDTKGMLSISPFLGEVFAEGPIKKGKSSWIASYRTSLIEQTSPWLLGEKQPLTFNNQFLKVSTGESNSRCSAMVMRTYDRGSLDAEEQSSIKWNNLVAGGRCLFLPQQQNYLINMNMGISYFSNTLQNENESEFFSDIARLQTDLNISRFSGSVEYNYGLFMNMKLINYSLSELLQSVQDESNTLLGMGIYLEASVPITPRLEINPGASLSVYPGIYPVSFEPRIQATWEPFGTEREQIDVSVGLYRQPIVGISDMRDAGSVFTAWMPSPDGAPQKEALQAQLGWQQSLGKGFSWSLEGYYKRLRNLPVTTWSPVAQFSTNLVSAKGDVYGGDVRIEYNRNQWYGFIGYGYNWIMYETEQDLFNTWFGEPVQRYHPSHDRRHQINSMISTEFRNFTVSARWQIGSGMPFTKPIGFDSIVQFEEELPSVKNIYGTPRVILDKPFQGRMPINHRLDISMERTFQFSESEISFQAGAINSYNQSNLFYYDVYTQRSLNQLPFAPYLSIKLQR